MPWHGLGFRAWNPQTHAMKLRAPHSTTTGFSAQVLKEANELLQFLRGETATTGGNLDALFVFDEMQILDW